MTVLDASAVLAFLKREPGWQEVHTALRDGARCGAANWSEVAQKVRSASGDWQLAATLLRSFNIAIEPVAEADAETAATLWRAGSGLSLADRLCIALAERLDTCALTADSAWAAQSSRAQLIR
ncbi:MAG: PIN domain-containing protein [Microbacteriaceae bacterium]